VWTTHQQSFIDESRETMLPTLETQERDFNLLDSIISRHGEFRPDPMVLSRLARAFYDKGGLKRSHLHFFSRTSWPSLKKYLEWLQNESYLEYNNADELYSPTEGGWTMFRLLSSFYDQINLKKKQPLALL